MNKIKAFVKSDKFKDEIGAWSLILFTGAVFGLASLVFSPPWWVVALIVLFGGWVFWFGIVILFFIGW